MAASKTNDHNKSQIQRHLSVHFSTSFTKGIAHSEVLEEIEKLVENFLIQSIQITEKNCIVTVFDPDTKHILLTRGIEIRNRYIKFVDVEKQVTNITIKDAPCELSNQVICAFMQKFGDVVQGSLRRGMIKGTNIETGTRYMQLTNCVPLIPIMSKFGRFDVRIFADSNRTECQYCSQTDHPSYRCVRKPSMAKARACFRCNSKDHTIKDCPHSDNVCYNCGKEGHIRRNCEAKDHDLYGDYMHDIHEGREADMDINNKFPEIGEITNDDNTTTNCVFSNESHPVMATQSVILGASNCTRLVFENPNVHNISGSGTTLDQVHKLLDKSDSQVDSENVDSVVLSLRTNDVTQYRHDTEQIIVNVTTCVENVKHKYPNASIGVCSILPRRGKGTHIQALNSVASSVNTFITKLCLKNNKMRFIDLWSKFTPNNVPNRALYKLNDPSGVHISEAGASVISDIILDYVKSPVEGEYTTPNTKKRIRSSTSTPGSTDKQQAKIPKPF